MRILFVFIFLISLNAFAADTEETSVVTATPSPSPTATPNTRSAAIEAQIKKMPLRKKVGQMFVIGFQGKTTQDEGLAQTLKDVAPGGIILFSRNIKDARQVSNLTLSAQKIAHQTSGVPLLIGVDQEGGNVIRIKTTYPLPSALAFGQTQKPELVKEAGQATGKLLKVLGFNMNFAPVLDVGNPMKTSFIGTRTYGRDPKVVGEMGASFSEGLMSAGVFPVGKHFPGHGGIAEDSHSEKLTKDLSLEELHEKDLVPFFHVQEKFPDKWGVMLAHISFPKIDPTGAPATFSQPIVKGVLRDEMKFDGLVITDDIGMAGAQVYKSVPERALHAIEAGADMVMVTWNKKMQRELVTAVEKAVRSGRISEERINESLRRILTTKVVYAGNPQPAPTNQQLLAAVKNPDFQKIAEGTVMSHFSGTPSEEELAFREYAEEKPILLFSANPRFAQTFQQSTRNRKVRIFGLDKDINRIMDANPEAVGVFYMSGYQAANIANKINEETARRMLLVTVEIQSLLKSPETFRHIADVYYRHPDLGKLIGGYYFNKPVEIRNPAASKKTKVVGVNERRND